MSVEMIGILSLLALIVLIYCGMRVGYAMFVVGFVGLIAIIGPSPALSVLSLMPYKAIASYTFAASAMFMMSGMIIFEAGFGADLFYAANKWLGRVKGGLAMATSLSSAVLGFITYSTVANITMGKIAVPEMQKFNYDDSLAAGSVCGGASLASVVPPSNGFILFSMLTATSLSSLYMGALIPAAVLMALMLVSIFVTVSLKPSIAPVNTQQYTMKEKIVSLKNVWPIILVIGLSLVGIYAGIVTPTEAAAVSAFSCMVLALITKRMTLKDMKRMVAGFAEMLGMLALLLTGAWVFTRLMTLSNLPLVLSGFISSLDMSRYAVMFIIIFCYVILGMISDINAAIIITIPIIYPIVTQTLGFNPVWFGVLVVSLIELGAISPPMGMNVFTLSGITQIPVIKIFKGAVPYMIALLIFIVILVVFPQIVTWLPSTMAT